MNLIFDFDGTICNSIKGVVSVANKIFAEYGYKTTSVEEIKLKGLKGIIKSRNISILKINKVIEDYRKISGEIYDDATLFSDMRAVFLKLSKGHTLGILTTNDKDVVEKFLQKNKLDCFSFVYSEKKIFGKHRTLKKIISQYKLDPEETYYIGDETRDIEAAKKQKLKTIAVSWGAESEKVLKNANPDKIITSPKQLLKLWK